MFRLTQGLQQRRQQLLQQLARLKVTMNSSKHATIGSKTETGNVVIKNSANR